MSYYPGQGYNGGGGGGYGYGPPQGHPPPQQYYSGPPQHHNYGPPPGTVLLSNITDLPAVLLPRQTMVVFPEALPKPPKDILLLIILLRLI